MPSFLFFGPGPLSEQGVCTLEFTSNISTVNASHGETCLEYGLVLAQSSISCSCEAREMEGRQSEMKRAVGTIGSRTLGMHSKRKCTICLGEHEQVDLIVTESVIRWASCNRLPTTPSLKSSLVC